MFSVFLFLSALLARDVAACDLNDCSLPDSAHLETPAAAPVPGDRFAWMNHDLALARSFLADGDALQARQLADTLDSAMRAQLPQMVRVRGADRVEAMFAALQDVNVNAGGEPFPLIPLERPVKPSRSARKAESGVSDTAKTESDDRLARRETRDDADPDIARDTRSFDRREVGRDEAPTAGQPAPDPKP